MWIHDVVVPGWDCMADWSAAFSRMVEFPSMLPFARPMMCILVVWWVGDVERFAVRGHLG